MNGDTLWKQPQSGADIQRILQMLRDTSYGSMDPLQLILMMLRRGVLPAAQRRTVGSLLGGSSGGSSSVSPVPFDIPSTGP